MASAAAATVRSKDAGRIAVTRSVPYAPGPRRTLDLYRPRDAARAPVVVFFYGGRWRGGRKETYRFVGRALARRGMVAVVCDYRVYPEVVYPGFIEDGAQAVRWVTTTIGAHGGDPRRIFVMGHSAGAHIAAMLALDGRWLAAVGCTGAIAGFIGLSGPYDFLPIRDPALIRVFGGADRPETQPIRHVGKRAPPALLITGKADRLVEPGNSGRLAKRMRHVGAAVRLVRYRHVGHALTVLALLLPAWLSRILPVGDEVAAFVAGTDRTPAAGLRAEREVA